MYQFDNLHTIYTVESIMTPKDKLKTWSQEDSYDKLLDDSGNVNFDVIPVKTNGRITSIVTSAAPCEIVELTSEWLLSWDTPVSDLPALFLSTEKPAFLIFRKSEVSGIVTPADLNKITFRTYLYTLIGSLEKAFEELVRKEYSQEKEILMNLPEKRQSSLKKIVDKAHNENVDVDLIHFLNLSDLLTIIQNNDNLWNILEFPSLENPQKELVTFRNSVMHPVRPVLQTMPADLQILKKLLDTIHFILSKV